jgi:group I intron endonuclease
MKIIGIYKITSPSGKIYIGQTVDFSKRLSAYRRLHAQGQTKLYNSLLKYGFDNHIIEMIKRCEPQELNYYERYYQEYYNSVLDGLNLRYTTTTDKSGSMSEETKSKMSKAWENREYDYNLLDKLTFKGLTHTKESKNKISNSLKGKKRTKEHSENISKALKGRIGLKHTEEYKEYYRKNSVRNKPVLQYDLNGNFIKEWISFSEVTRELGISNNMYLHLKGVVKQIGGFVWRYKDC